MRSFPEPLRRSLSLISSHARPVRVAPAYAAGVPRRTTNGYPAQVHDAGAPAEPESRRYSRRSSDGTSTSRRSSNHMSGAQSLGHFVGVSTREARQGSAPRGRQLAAVGREPHAVGPAPPRAARRFHAGNPLSGGRQVAAGEEAEEAEV